MRAGLGAWLILAALPGAAAAQDESFPNRLGGGVPSPSITAPAFPPAPAEAEATLRKYGRCIFFVDSLDSSQMESGFREVIPAWLGRHHDRAFAHLLLKSKLIEMAANIGNLIARHTISRAYTSIAAWEEAGRRELGAPFQRRPITRAGERAA